MQFTNKYDESHKLRTKELKWVDLCTGTKYKIATMFTSFLLKMSGLQLDQRRQNSSLKNILKPIDLALPFATTNKDTTTMTSRILQTLSFTLITYISLSTAVMGVLQYMHDKLLAEINPRLDPNAIQYGQCVLNSSLHLDVNDLHRKEELEFVNRWIDFFGNPWTLMPGVSEIGCTWMIMSMFVLPALGMIYTSKNTVQHDHLSFLFDPLGERLRVRQELARIVKFKMEELDNLISNIVRIYTETKRANTKSASDPIARDPFMRVLRRPSLPSKCFKNSLVLELAHYRLLLTKIQRLNLVKPTILSFKSYKKTINVHLCVLIPIFCLNLILIHTIVFGLTYLALLAQTTHRLEDLQCKRWMPNAVHLSHKVHLDPLSSAADRELYTNYDGSLEYYIWLATFVEAKYLFTPSVLLTQVSTQLIICTFWPFWITFYTYLHFCSASRRSAWIGQLERQIRDCRQSMDTGMGVFSSEQFARDLIIANLNLELFRCYRRDNVKFDKFILNQAALLVGSIFLVCQWARDVMTINDLPLKMSTIYLALMMNTYLLSEVSNVSKLEKLNRNFMSLAAKSEEFSVYRSYPMQLWVRQIINDSWRRMLSELFGFQLSYTRILSFNGYFFIFWFLLMR